MKGRAGPAGGDGGRQRGATRSAGEPGSVARGASGGSPGAAAPRSAPPRLGRSVTPDGEARRRGAPRGEGRKGETPAEGSGGRRREKGRGTGPLPGREVASDPRDARARGGGEPFGRNRLPSRRPSTQAGPGPAAAAAVSRAPYSRPVSARPRAPASQPPPGRLGPLRTSHTARRRPPPSSRARARARARPRPQAPCPRDRSLFFFSPNGRAGREAAGRGGGGALRHVTGGAEPRWRPPREVKLPRRRLPAAGMK